ncbi:MAG: hypothetical protein AAGF11_16495 [Myxococcota bacterium]
MAEVELSPAELDRLEDALEDLELDGSLDRWLEDEPSVAVREPLADYRSVLALSRQVLPVEEVPAGLLDGVIAEAHEATNAPAVAPISSAGPSESSSERWWSRWRRTFLVPALALAGTAALVLWIGRPDQQMQLAEAPAGPPAGPPAAQASPSRTVKLSFDEELPEDQAAARGVQSEVAADPSAAAPPPSGAEADKANLADEEPEIVQPAQIPRLDSLGDAPDDDKGEDGSAAAGQDPVPSDGKPNRSAGSGVGSASGRWDIVELGDRSRKAGDCIGARDDYALALEDDEAGVRARAFAGIGLCDRQDGDMPSAEANFDRARELDGDIDRFIDSQRRSGKRKRRSPKARKKKPAMNDVMEPFG